MATSKVSNEFLKAFSKADGIDDAKKAESRAASIPFPIGWEGTVVVSAMIGDVSKEKDDGKGGKRGGNMYINMEVAALNDKQYQGKKATKNWTFSNSEKATAADRFEWFLNDCEGMGLPRDIRMNHETPQEIIDWFTNPDSPVSLYAKVEKDEYNRLEGKKIILRAMEEALDASMSMAPAVEIKSQSHPEKVEGGIEFNGKTYPILRKVQFLGKSWNLFEEAGNKCKLQNAATGKIREDVDIDALD